MRWTPENTPTRAQYLQQKQGAPPELHAKIRLGLKRLKMSNAPTLLHRSLNN